MSAKLTLTIPAWLDLLFTWPLLLYRRLKFGYSFRRISLGDGRFTTVDPDVYYRLNCFNWSAIGQGDKIYAVRYLTLPNKKTKTLRMHREIINAPTRLVVDHENCNSLDNRLANLRLATNAQNVCNRRKTSSKTSSAFRGVHLNKRSGKWIANIGFQYKNIWLGSFDNEIDAARAYDEAAKKYHGEFAKLNFPKEIERSPRRLNLRLANWLGARLNFADKTDLPQRRKDAKYFFSIFSFIFSVSSVCSVAKKLCGKKSPIRDTHPERRSPNWAFTLIGLWCIMCLGGLVRWFTPDRPISKRDAGQVRVAVNFEKRWKMPITTFYFQMHQPFRLHPDREKFLWDEMNKKVFEKVSHKCYLPATKMFTRLIADNPSFKITLGMSGTFLEQAQMFVPDVIKCLQELLEAGKNNNQVEFLEETYYHSLASLFADPNRQEFRDQVSLHRAKMEEIFKLKPSSFRNTELMFNNEIADVVADMGYKAILCEKRNDMFGLQNGKMVSPNAVFRAKNSKLIVIPRNRELSDDVAFRFPHTPMPAEQYASHIAKIDGEAVLLGYDFEHLGEHIWKDKGIFEFWQNLPGALASHGSIKMANPAEVAEFFKDADCPIVDIHGLSTSSWADANRDTFGWLGTRTQQELFFRIQNFETKIKKSNADLLTRWRFLTTSDHLYFLHESTGSDHAVHSYFSPYGSIGETVRTVTDKIWAMERSVEAYFHILKKTGRIPVIIISPETDRLPTEGMGDFAKYVAGKSGGMGEVVAALCTGLYNKDVLIYVVTLNLERRFVEKSGMSRHDYMQKLFHLPRDKIKTVDSSLFENYSSAYDGDPRATAAEFQRQIRRSLLSDIISKHEGRGIIHSHDWMSGGIISAFAKLIKIPLLHTLHNSHTGHIPLEFYQGVNLGELWNNLYFSNDRGKECVDSQATAIKNATLVSYVGTRFLEETIQDYFVDRYFIPPSVRQETKAKYRYGSVLAIPNGISPGMYPENQSENPDIDEPGLAKKYGINDNVIAAKKLNLVKFQKKTGLKVDENAILLYWPSRLDRMQKGVELLEDIALKFVIEHPDSQIAIIGNPVGDDRNDADILGRIACTSGGKIAYWPFDDDLSILGYAAASDVFGASLYEPFGQIDLVGNLFGATATNRDTGGFHDKIVPLRLKARGEPADVGNGVLFTNYDPGGLWHGLHTTVENHRFFRKNPEEWERQAKRIMREARDNWGLDKMVAGYLAAYQKILGYPLI